MKKKHLRTVAQNLIDTYNASLKVEHFGFTCENRDRPSGDELDLLEYIDARLSNVIENCLQMLNDNLSDDDEIIYTDKKLAELARMENYLKGEKVETMPTTPITLEVIKAGMPVHQEIWEGIVDPKLEGRYNKVRKEFIEKCDEGYGSP